MITGGTKDEIQRLVGGSKLLIEQRERLPVNHATRLDGRGTLRGGLASSAIEVRPDEDPDRQRTSVVESIDPNDKRGYLKAKIRASQDSGFMSTEGVQHPYKRPDVFAPGVSASRMRYPLVLTSSTLPATFNEFTCPEVFAPESIFSTSSAMSLKIPAGSSSYSNGHATQIAQRAFKAGRFDRVIEGGSEIAVSMFTSEVIFHMQVPSIGSEVGRFVLSGPGITAHSSQYRENANTNSMNNLDTIYSQGGLVAVEKKYITAERSDRLQDGTIQVQTDPPGPNFFPDTQIREWDGVVEMSSVVLGGWITLSLKKVWTAKTTVTETSGKELIGTVGQDGLPLRVKTQTLNTSLSWTYRIRRIF